jgi:O-antigen/teichoic acid export membrane protein
MRLVKNTLVFSFANLFPPAANFLLLPLYTRYLSVEGYGLANTVLVLSGILAIIYTLGTERSIFRLYYDYKSDAERKKFLGTVFTLIVLTATIVFIVLTVFGLAGIKPFSSIPFYPLIFIVLITELLNVFGHIPKIVYQVGQQTYRFVSISLIQFIVSNIFIFWFVVLKEMGAFGMLLGYFMGSLVLLPFYLIENLRLVTLSVNKKVIREIFAFSLPMIPALAAAWVMNLADIWILESKMGLVDVGVFALGSKIGSLLLIINSAFFRAYNPFFYQIANENSFSQAKAILYETNRFFLLIILFCSFLLAFFSPELILIFFEPSFEQSGMVVPFFALSYFVSSIHGMMNLYLYQMKKTNAVSFVLIFGGITSFLCNVTLIPLFGIFGAAISVLVANITIVSIEYFFARRAFYIPFDWKIIGFASAMVVVILLIFSKLALEVWPMLLVKFIFFVFLFGIIWMYKGNLIKNHIQRIQRL